jgi:hypothetical protein
MKRRATQAGSLVAVAENGDLYVDNVLVFSSSLGVIRAGDIGNTVDTGLVASSALVFSPVTNGV